MRKFGDPVQVRSAEGSQQRPEAFLWRGRLYVVREVLAQWRERRAWWRDAVDDPDREAGAGVDGLAAASAEQQVWRVEASPGWSFAPGVYDLAHVLVPGDSGPDERWSLLHVAD
ncbi:MAG TPA: DUF6504 family protein [Intrasporangium sp.]|uniref:DUF6504 family protein n=1 Tax=Intrasporangium sp. TaxID=1925024 RepID=UPI002D766DD4|nr:DUF6504 family protein [Intrasporangium sp.]HET7399330.1 DUF6504 family protein [Intrasporangium sp.]